MNLARRILERIHEVELDISPEFQKGVSDPEITHGPVEGEVTWDFGNGDTIVGRFTPRELAIDASVSSMFVPSGPWPRIRSAFRWIKDHLTDFTSEGLGIYLKKVDTEEQKYASRLLSERLIDGFSYPKASKVDHGEGGRAGTLDKPKVRTDNVHTWWEFGPALTLVGKVYPSQKRIDILGHASSIEARVRAVMKMFSWLRAQYAGYYIEVQGGYGKPDVMTELVNGGYIDKFVPKDEGEDEEEGRGPFVVEKHTPSGVYYDESRFETLEEAKDAGIRWKKGVEDDNKEDPTFNPEDYIWDVLDAYGEKVAEEEQP